MGRAEFGPAIVLISLSVSVQPKRGRGEKEGLLSSLSLFLSRFFETLLPALLDRESWKTTKSLDHIPKFTLSI